MERCPNCRSTRLVSDEERGETCCAACGVVLDDRAHDGSRGIEGESEPVRPGVRATVMKVPAGSRGGMARLAAYDGRIGTRHIPSALRGGSMSGLLSMCGKVGLPAAVRARAVDIYAMAANGGWMAGRTLASMMAASIYVACREAGVPRTMHDLTVHCNVRPRRLAKDVTFIMQKAGLNPPQYGVPALVSRLANTVGASTGAVRAALDQADALDEAYTSGKNPAVLAAALLHVGMRAEGEGTTARSLALAAGVSDVSMRMRYNEIISGRVDAPDH